MIQTFQYRVKDSSKIPLLTRLNKSVNLVWNYCNNTSFEAIRNRNKFLTEFDLMKLTAGSSKELGVNSSTIQFICEEYVLRRKQFKKRKLGWRSYKKSLGWIPFKANAIKVNGNIVTYYGHDFKVWLSRPIEGKILCGSFSENAQGKWFVNITCEVDVTEDHERPKDAVGIDLGLKTSATLSDGSTIDNNQEYRKLEAKLGKAQRARKKKQVKKIHTKIKNKRNDYLHKETTKVSKKYHTVIVGNVSGTFLQKTNGKSLTDASIGKIRTFLKYKAIKHSGRYFEVSENSSTITCAACLKETGPRGLSGLGVREWTCSHCGARHERDVNAAKNILRFGRESLRAAKAA